MKKGLRQWVADRNNKLSLFKRGRLSRLEFLRNYAISYILSFVPFLISLASAMLLGGDGAWQHALESLPVRIILVLICLTMYATTVLIYVFAFMQRAHDFHKSGWFILLLFVPLVNFIIFLIFIFKKGDLAENKYGPLPRGVKRKWLIFAGIAFCLLMTISLMLVAFQKLNFPTAEKIVDVSSQASDQDKELLIRAKNDPFVTYVRTAINDFNAGKAGNVDLGKYREYLQSKFVLMQINNAAVMGGKDMLIAFTDKPEMFFYVWVYKQGDGAYELRAFAPFEIPPEEAKRIYDNARPVIEELHLAI